MPPGHNQLSKAMYSTLTNTCFGDLTIRNLRYTIARFYITAINQQLASLPSRETSSRAHLLVSTPEPGIVADICALATRINRTFYVLLNDQPNITPIYPVDDDGAGQLNTQEASRYVIICRNNQYSVGSPTTY